MKTKSIPIISKNIDVLVSMLSSDEILGANEMICVRGGDNEPGLPPPPPIIFPNSAI